MHASLALACHVLAGVNHMMNFPNFLGLVGVKGVVGETLKYFYISSENYSNWYKKNKRCPEKLQKKSTQFLFLCVFHMFFFVVEFCGLLGFTWYVRTYSVTFVILLVLTFHHTLKFCNPLHVLENK